MDGDSDTGQPSDCSVQDTMHALVDAGANDASPSGQQTDLPPAIAMASDGSYAVAWTTQALGAAGVTPQAWVARFSPGGAAVGDPVLVSELAEALRTPALALADDGSFVVVWLAQIDNFGSAGWGDVMLRRFDADGDPLADATTVDPQARLSQLQPSIDMAADGRFVVGWSPSYFTGINTAHIDFAFAMYEADGSPAGAPQSPHPLMTGIRYAGDVALGPDGDVAVVWGALPTHQQLFVRRYAADGSLLHDTVVIEFPAVAYEYSDPDGAVTLAPNGDAVVSWIDGAEPNAQPAARLQAFTAQGDAVFDAVTLAGGLPATARAATGVNANGQILALVGATDDGAPSLLLERFDPLGVALAPPVPMPAGLQTTIVGALATSPCRYDAVAAVVEEFGATPFGVHAVELQAQQRADAQKPCCRGDQ
ncbi:MAG: hypothetical protein AAF721_14885 [Myxococcota bacterium]